MSFQTDLHLFIFFIKPTQQVYLAEECTAYHIQCRANRYLSYTCTCCFCL